MAKKRDDVGAEFLLDLINTLDDTEKSALDAIRRFIASVDEALPGDGKRTPGRRVEIVEAALKMIERLLDMSNDTARRITESVRTALPEIEQDAQELLGRATSKATKKAPARRPSAKKGAAKKKAPARKTTAKRAPAKKTAAKKAAAKKASARS
jgi:hypothetical protein